MQKDSYCLYTKFTADGNCLFPLHDLQSNIKIFSDKPETEKRQYTQYELSKENPALFQLVCSFICVMEVIFFSSERTATSELHR